MRCACARADAPPGGGGCCGSLERIGNEEAGSRGAGSGKAQAARRRQCHLGHDADDERQALRSQAFLHGPKCIARALRLDEKAGGGGKAQTGEAVAVRASELAGEHGRPAPEYLRRRTT